MPYDGPTPAPSRASRSRSTPPPALCATTSPPRTTPLHSAPGRVADSWASPRPVRRLAAAVAVVAFVTVGSSGVQSASAAFEKAAAVTADFGGALGHGRAFESHTTARSGQRERFAGMTATWRSRAIRLGGLGDREERCASSTESSTASTWTARGSPWAARRTSTPTAGRRPTSISPPCARTWAAQPSAGSRTA